MSRICVAKGMDQACQEIIEKWRSDHLGERFDIEVITEFAVRSRLIEIQPRAILREVRRQFARAARKRHITDPQGRRVRAYVPVRVDIPGQRKQKYLWDSCLTMSDEHAHSAFQQQWDHIAGQCKSLHFSQCSFNDNNPNGATNPSQLMFDFTHVLESQETPPIEAVTADEFVMEEFEKRDRLTRKPR